MATYPEVAVFDLDYTLWPCYCDTHVSPPFEPVLQDDGQVHCLVDNNGYEIGFYKDVPRILTDLKSRQVLLVSASRTWAPEIAREMLELFVVQYQGQLVKLAQLFDAHEWGERSKVGHITDALRALNPQEPHPTLKNHRIWLFDDEKRNKDVEKHGIRFVYVPDPERGLTWDIYSRALQS